MGRGGRGGREGHGNYGGEWRQACGQCRNESGLIG